MRSWLRACYVRFDREVSRARRCRDVPKLHGHALVVALDGTGDAIDRQRRPPSSVKVAVRPRAAETRARTATGMRDCKCALSGIAAEVIEMKGARGSGVTANARGAVAGLPPGHVSPTRTAAPAPSDAPRITRNRDSSAAATRSTSAGSGRRALATSETSGFTERVADSDGSTTPAIAIATAAARSQVVTAIIGLLAMAVDAARHRPARRRAPRDPHPTVGRRRRETTRARTPPPPASPRSNSNAVTAPATSRIADEEGSIAMSVCASAAARPGIAAGLRRLRRQRGQLGEGGSCRLYARVGRGLPGRTRITRERREHAGQSSRQIELLALAQRAQDVPAAGERALQKGQRFFLERQARRSHPLPRAAPPRGSSRESPAAAPAGPGWPVGRPQGRPRRRPPLPR